MTGTTMLEMAHLLMAGSTAGLGLLAIRAQVIAQRAQAQWHIAGLGDADPETQLLTMHAADTELHRLTQLADDHDSFLSAVVLRLDPREPVPAARAVAEGIRVSDVAWRVDHDTVCVLVLSPTRHDAVRAAHRICTLADHHAPTPGAVRAGIASWPEDGNSAWELAYRAEQRMAPLARWKQVTGMINAAYPTAHQTTVPSVGATPPAA